MPNFTTIYCLLFIALTAANCKKDKDNAPPPPQDRWEAIAAPQRNIGTANWSFNIGNEVFFGNKDNNLHFFDLDRKVWVGSFNYPNGFEERWNCAVAVHNNKAYIGSGRSGNGFFLRDWWEFDPSASLPWKQLADCPVEGADGRAFILNNTLYSALQINGAMGDQSIQTKVFTYDITNDEWDTHINQLSKNCGTSGFSFLLNNQFHFGAGYNNRIPGSIFTREHAAFNPANQQTTALAEFPVELQSAENGITFTHNGKGYVLGKKHDLYEYDPGNNKWRTMNKVPEEAGKGVITYVHQYNGKTYGFTSKGFLYQYVPE
ncbi:MAG: hypothetical protein ACTHMC_21065 [Pseudobacter sp.]|uniref:hypothetical protein n=1 Tax=Pseudobacter sp. TaxID=2045420 RepID=UPI003F8135A6